LPAAQDIASAALAFERDFIRPDGRRITVQFQARRLPTALPGRSGGGPDPGQPSLWLAEDVTERRQQERELQAAKLQAETASQ
ncbi:hypothetical protein ABTK75_19955, partial [Acinetobacter baumannii]